MEKLSTGSFDFNKFLYGGYEKDIITMIAGPAGSGKTNFCILGGCSSAKEGKKVIFIDTEGGFSVDRVKQIVGENYEEILKNFYILNPTNFEEQKKAFGILLDKLKKEQVGLIIIDGMAMLYRLELGDAVKSSSSKVQEINREVANQMRILAEIARKKKIPVLITNQVYAEFQSEDEWKKGSEKTFNLVGGDLFKYWSKCIIQLSNSAGRRKASLLKHRSLPEKEMSFLIKDEGVFKRKWI